MAGWSVLYLEYHMHCGQTKAQHKKMLSIISAWPRLGMLNKEYLVTVFKPALNSYIVSCEQNIAT